ncbi:MAG: murein biosynthesis integral membrane protein MurJ [Chloroflexi bacterium]|nr:murein biosynthesis integral membrane protein MurJ [Chloroflexota bacterium]
MTESTANRQIARAAGTVMVALVLGQIAGLIRGILVAGAFGASPDLDAFYAANRVSETLFLLVAGGALGSAFIPTFTGLLAKGDRSSAWRLASALASIVTLVLGILALILAVLAPQVVRYALAPGLSSDPNLFALTVNLLRIQLISAILFGLGGLVIGILNAHRVFLIPALMPAAYQFGIILGTLLLAPTIGIYGLAWGVVVGAGFYLVLQLPPLWRQNGTYSPTLGLQNPIVREVILLMGPRLLGVAVVQLNFWVNTWLASRMSPGSVSGLYYGFSLMLMAQAAIAQSVAIAAMPTFSSQHALGKRDEMRASLAASLRGVILLATPASLGLMLLRDPLISLLYERGEFDARSVQIVSWALLWYAAGLLGHAIMEVLTRAFYAQHDTRTPVIIGTIAMGLNVVFSIAFSIWFESLGWLPLGGLAFANSLATAIEAAALFLQMRKRLNGIEGFHILRGFLFSALAAGAMALCIIPLQQTMKNQNGWVAVPTLILCGGGIYLATLRILRVPEILFVYSALLRKWRR